MVDPDMVLETSPRLHTEVVESRLRLQTIVRLRWFAVVGQTIAVAVVPLGFGFPLPVGYCLVIIACSAWLNVFLRVLYPARHRLSSRFATVLLVYDLLQLAALLYLTGGIENPFVILLVAPVTVSAATLPLRHTLLIGTVAMVCAAVLTKYHLPLPWDAAGTLAGPVAIPALYKFGILVAIAACMSFQAIYTWRLSKEAREMSAALTATEFVLAHEQKLHALDGLAAAAAHELGTPLATIALVSKELERTIEPTSPYAEDIALLRSQAQRCRDILKKLTRSPQEQDPLHATLSVGQLIEEAVEPHRDGAIEIVIDAGPASATLDAGGSVSEPVGERRPGVIHGLGNIVENAVDFAAHKVEITARWSEREVRILICDDGLGFSPEILDTIGEPYVTSRSSGSRSRLRPDDETPRSGHGGLGLGFFIAKTLLERSGATLSFGNRSDGRTGALVRIAWPREAFEVAQTGWGLPSTEGEALSLH